MIRVRVTPSQKSIIEQNARDSNMELSNYLRFLALQGLRVQAESVERIEVESTKIKRIVEDEDHQPKRRHAAG